MSAFVTSLRADLARCADVETLSPWRTFAVLRGEIGLQALVVYRFGRVLRAALRRPLLWPLLPFGWLLYAMAAELVRECYDIHLHLSADLGPGLWIGHFGGIVLVNCRVGARCSVGQQTKVGRRDEEGGPRIGNNVWIGAHAAVYDSVQVGDGATIAPGARVVKDVPPQALVVGNPARVALRGYDNSAFTHSG